MLLLPGSGCSAAGAGGLLSSINELVSLLGRIEKEADDEEEEEVGMPVPLSSSFNPGALP